MKALTLVLCAVMLVASTVFATVAFLTSTTETVENTFTVGKVNIILNEADVDTNGAYVKDITTRDLTNEYHLLPGLSYIKDPTVQVKTDSEDCYVRMMVTVTVPAAAADKIGTDLTNIVTGHDEAIWVRKNQTVTPGEDATIIVYEYRYNGIVDASTLPAGYEADYGKLPALFTGITVPGDYDNAAIEALSGLKIDVIAHAIQSAGFTATENETAEDVAWAAFDKQTETNN